MKKAWDTHPLCRKCKKTRTKNGVCSKCAPNHQKKKQRLTKEMREAFVQAAQRTYHDEGRIEIDDGAKVSWCSPEDGGSGGAYVQAWVWVYDED